MASLLPRQLRIPLTVELSDIDAGPSAIDLPQREAKRRRIETIANQYLAGAAPFIQSAALRGPFDSGWDNPWSKRRLGPRDASPKPAASIVAGWSRRRQDTRERSLRPDSADHSRVPPTTRERMPIKPTVADREGRAKAEAEQAEETRRKEKMERRERRRHELRKREQKAAEAWKDGLGKSPAQPIDLTAEGDDCGLPTRPIFAALQAGARPGQDDEDDIVRSREYGAREIRSSFTDEWLSRLGSPAKTPELSPVQASAVDHEVNASEALMPTRRPPKRSKVSEKPSGQPGRNPSRQHDCFKPSAPRSDSKSADARRNRNLASSNESIPRSSNQARRILTLSGAGATRTGSQDVLQKHPRSTLNNRGASHRLASASRNTGTEDHAPSSLPVNLNEGSLPKPTSAENGELAGDIQVIRNNIFPLSTSPATDRYIHSRFMQTNHRFHSPLVDAEEPVESTTPPGRPALGLKATSNNAGPAGGMHPQFEPGNEGVLVMSAGAFRLDTDAVYAVAKGLEGQENNGLVRGQQKSSKQLLLRGALVQSAENCAASVRARSKKPKRTHPLQASPDATNSPGFTYRKVSDPTENVPKVRSSNQTNKRTMVQKKRARMMTFGSLPMEPSETPEPQISACDSNATEQPCIAQNSEGLFKQVEQVDKGNESSPTRDLSTQAAILFAQQEFQQVLEPPSKDQSVFSPDRDIGSQRTQTSIPAPSQPPVAYTAVTPFKDFNKGRLFLDENPSQTEPVPTQELLNAASPYDFSTVKKNTNKRKRVSLAVSPLKFTEKQKAEGRKVEDRNIESNNGAEPRTAIGTPTQGGLNGHITADVTFADKSTTPSSPRLPTFVTDPQSSGLKPYSLNPTLSSAIRLKPSRFMAASLVSSQISSSFPRLGQPMSSAPQPASSHALRQEYRRARSQSRSQSQTQSQSQSSQQRSSQQQQPAQGRELTWDDVDVDSAIDAADSFLDTANLGLERGTPGR